MSDKTGTPGRHENKQTLKEFTALSFFWRFLASLLLVVATYNPSGYSFAHWIRNAFSASGLGPEHFVAGIALVIGWVILVAATKRWTRWASCSACCCSEVSSGS